MLECAFYSLAFHIHSDTGILKVPSFQPRVFDRPWKLCQAVPLKFHVTQDANILVIRHLFSRRLYDEKEDCVFEGAAGISLKNVPSCQKFDVNYAGFKFHLQKSLRREFSS